MPLLYSKSNVLYFSHIPKAAGTSVEKFVIKNGGQVLLKSRALSKEQKNLFPCTPQHFHISLIDVLLQEAKVLNKIAIVRNPVERLLSEYAMRDRILKERGSIIDEFDVWVEKTFLSYKAGNYYIYDNHIRPQVEFIDSKTKIYKFEDGIDSVFKYVGRNLFPNKDLHYPTEKFNTNKRRSCDVSKETILKIKEFYQDDYSRFYQDLL